MLADTTMLHEMRPEIIGGTLAIEPDGTLHRDRRVPRRGQRPRGREDGAACRGALGARVDDGRGEVLRPPPPLVRVGLSGTDRPMSFDVTRRRLPALHGPVVRTPRRRVPRAADVRSPGRCSTSAAARARSPRLLVDRYGAPAVAAIDPSRLVRRGHARAASRARRPPGRRPRRCPYDDDVLRRRPGSAGRALHDRPGRRAARHGPGDQAGRCRRAPASGTTPAAARPLSLFWDAAQRRRPRGAERGGACRGPTRASSPSSPRRPGSRDITSSTLTVRRALRVVRRVVGAVPARGRPAGCLRRRRCDDDRRRAGAVPRAAARGCRSSSPRPPGACGPSPASWLLVDRASLDRRRSRTGLSRRPAPAARAARRAR